MNSEHFAVETLMDGFEIMSEYLLKNVDPDKIIYINKNRTFGNKIIGICCAYRRRCR